MIPIDPKIEKIICEGSPLKMPEYDNWECYLFGMGTTIVITPLKGEVPNWFWRTMQYLVFGNKWKKAAQPQGENDEL